MWSDVTYVVYVCYACFCCFGSCVFVLVLLLVLCMCAFHFVFDLHERDVFVFGLCNVVFRCVLCCVTVCADYGVV